MEGRGAEEEKSLVDTFCGVTSATREEAVFFLESHNWNLDSAVHSYYDDDRFDAPLPQQSTGGEEEVGGGGDGDDDDDDEDYLPPEAEAAAAVKIPVHSVSSSSGSRAEKKASGSRSTIRTLADLNRKADSGSDSDSDEPQEYYTGGEKSGMLVRDPSRGGRDVDSIFEQAKQMGAMQGPFESHQTPSSSRSFIGTSRLLSGETISSATQQPKNTIHNIYFWSNGFTVNDGPLRRFDDLENASFLESIRKSECPKELEPAGRRSAVSVNLIRREENYPEPVRRSSPFQGVGRTLGSGSLETSIHEPVVSVAASSTLPSPNIGLSVDASLPSTSIQLRLADGTRMIVRFNAHHTIGDIRSFIDASRPGAARTYRLQTVGFPPKELDDVSRTIEEEGLANSVVIQKL
ncbi:plant UBX domain-containing protein 4-like [Typha latifolia]|uniref:plant UBX domain-containing protein 4-like n=1 Tax=Typha latifolia TaxID=4733 RepID=UPI003C2B3DFA